MEPLDVMEDHVGNNDQLTPYVSRDTTQKLEWISEDYSKLKKRKKLHPIYGIMYTWFWLMKVAYLTQLELLGSL